MAPPKKRYPPTVITEMWRVLTGIQANSKFTPKSKSNLILFYPIISDLFFYLFIYSSIYLSIYPSIHPSIHLSIYLSIHPSIHPFSSQHAVAQYVSFFLRGKAVNFILAPGAQVPSFWETILDHDFSEFRWFYVLKKNMLTIAVARRPSHGSLWCSSSCKGVTGKGETKTLAKDLSEYKEFGNLI